jgi:hypothetical protein
MVTGSAIFLFKKVPECKEWSKTLSERGDSYTKGRKKGSRTPFWLHRFEKELLEQHSGAK